MNQRKNINGEILISNYTRYVNIATSSNEEATKAALSRNAIVAEGNIDHLKLIKVANDVHDKATISIIFSVMAIEAFINEYGTSNFSGNYFKNHLDNLSLISKLVIIPKLANDIELDKGGQVYQEVKWLVDFRNFLVHFRPRKREVEDIDMTDPMSQKDFVMESHSERAVKTMSMLIDSLNNSSVLGTTTG